MGSYLVFKKTLRDMLGIRRIAAVILLVVLGLVLYCTLETNGALSTQVIPTASSSVSLQTQFVADKIVFIWYIWAAGLLLAVMASANAAGSISKEVTDGTLAFVVNKPISRYQVIAGKLLALIVNSILLLAIGYLLSILLLWGILNLDMDSLQVLFGLMPYLLLHALIVALFFGSISIAFSALMNSHVKIVVIAMVLVMYTFSIGLLLRAVIAGEESNPYADYRIYSVDSGYSISNTLHLISSDIDFWEMLPEQQGFYGEFTGIYHDSPIEDRDSLAGQIYYSNPTEYMNPVISVLTLLGISACAIGAAVWLLNRKQL